MVLNITWYVCFRVIPSVIYENMAAQTPSIYSHIHDEHYHAVYTQHYSVHQTGKIVRLQRKLNRSR